MTNRTVAIVGDSISFDHYLSLSHLLGVPRASPRAMKKTALLTSQVCGSTSLLLGKRDFHLTQLSGIIKDYFPDVLVLNRGAHYAPDDKLMEHIHTVLIGQLQAWQQQCKEQGKDCLLVWRTSVPGHPNCTQYTKPSTSLQEMEELVRSAQISHAYKWDQFSAQNKLVVNYLRQHATNLSYEIMDAYHVNILRPDFHRSSDCLHTCLPKDNTYSWLIHHILQVKYGGAAHLAS